MRVKIKVEKRGFLVVMAMLFLLAGVLSVYAYNSGGPPFRVGHDGGEIEQIPYSQIDGAPSAATLTSGKECGILDLGGGVRVNEIKVGGACQVGECFE